MTYYVQRSPANNDCVCRIDNNYLSGLVKVLITQPFNCQLNFVWTTYH